MPILIGVKMAKKQKKNKKTKVVNFCELGFQKTFEQISSLIDEGSEHLASFDEEEAVDAIFAPLFYGAMLAIAKAYHEFNFSKGDFLETAADTFEVLKVNDKKEVFDAESLPEEIDENEVDILLPDPKDLN